MARSSQIVLASFATQGGEWISAEREGDNCGSIRCRSATLFGSGVNDEPAAE